MIRRFNYKRSRQITQDMFDFEIENSNGLYFLKINNLDLSSLDYDPDFEVKINVWVAMGRKLGVKTKIELGTIGNIETDLDIVNSKLPFIREGLTHKVYGEVFIVDPLNAYLKKTTSSEVVLKEFDILETEGSLLPVQYDDLDERPWQVKFFDDELPVLTLNNKLKDTDFIEHLKGRGKLVQSLVIYPAFKEILRYIVINEQTSKPEDCEEEWMREWLTFALRVNSSRIPEFEHSSPNYDDVEEWIDSVSESLSKKGAFIEGIKKDLIGRRD